MTALPLATIDPSPPLARRAAPLQLGALTIDPPVILAPMAGVTNYPFRALCRSFGAPLCVSEMITARPLVEGVERTRRLAAFGPDEAPRSLQLYGTDPFYVGEAVKKLVGEGLIDHLDMNFGCPVPKVTRKGGGSALPARPKLLQAIVRAAVRNAGAIPVTIKFRIGIDDDWHTFRDAGDIGAGEGCAAVTLHARTAAQLYDGQADWNYIGELVARLPIPVLGNGDIWDGNDARRMMAQTGCAGVVVGRGCLGRPWLFRELEAALRGEEAPPPPTLGEVADVMLRHAASLADWIGEETAMRAFRRHSTWYTKGFRGSAQLRTELTRAERLDDLRGLLAAVDRNEPFPPHAGRLSRGKKGGCQRVALPAGFRDSIDSLEPPEEDGGDGGDGG